ncbi:hypothetical protein Bbelb_234430 [Branchiostoma belcheri]|nr:hypothetical protein Bbelb_234430 [Branchiostoma belcheri]
MPSWRAAGQLSPPSIRDEATSQYGPSFPSTSPYLLPSAVPPFITPEQTRSYESPARRDIDILASLGNPLQSRYEFHLLNTPYVPREKMSRNNWRGKLTRWIHHTANSRETPRVIDKASRHPLETPKRSLSFLPEEQSRKSYLEPTQSCCPDVNNIRTDQSTGNRFTALEPSCRNLSQPPLVRTSGAHDPPPGHARPLLLTIRVLSPDVTTSAARQKSRNPAFRADGKVQENRIYFVKRLQALDSVTSRDETMSRQREVTPRRLAPLICVSPADAKVISTVALPERPRAFPQRQLHAPTLS